MDLNQLFIICLKRPTELPLKLSPIKLKLNTIVEAAIFIAAITSLLNSSVDRLVFKSVENASELLQNNALSVLFNPLSMFAFELIFILTIMISILIFSNFSSKNISIEELGKNVVFLCFVAFVLKFIQAAFVFVSYDLYYILRFLEMLWFVWALSSVVAILYGFKSVLLTAFFGVITISLVMGFLFMALISFLQFFAGDAPNV